MKRGKEKEERKEERMKERNTLSVLMSSVSGK
jgi:hypothetical protein